MRRFFCFIILLTGLVQPFAQTDEQTLGDLEDKYFTTRNGFLSSSTKKIKPENQQELDAILLQLKEKDEASFEYNLVAWVNSNYSKNAVDYLFKAYALKNSDETAVREMLAYYIITSNYAKQKEFLAKVQKFYTPAEIGYYTDAMPTGKAILITSGQEDMYGFLCAQASQGIGTDVQIFNMDFMKNSDYREFVSNNTGINDQVFLGSEKEYLKAVLTGSTNKIYVSSTVPQDYLALVADKIYITGLFYQYGNVDQLTALNNFWSKIKTKDMSQITLSKSAENKLYGNYLPPLLTLFMFDKTDAVLKTAIKAIAAKVGKTEEVDEIIRTIETEE
ncbi:MAG: hypothetical protein JNJ99_06750 [Crocinitomicaceae bacterium]|nr:hypothetical protein [Crocinitomicaceae bacterium]